MIRKASILSILLAILILIGAFYGSKHLSSQKEAPKRKEVPKVTKTVKTQSVNTESIQSAIPIDGRLVAYEKVDLFAEVGGLLLATEKRFKEGVYYEEDEVIFRVDNEELNLNILGQKSNLQTAITQMLPDLKFDYLDSFQQWEAYLNNFKLDGRLKAFPKPLSQKEKYFVASRNIHSLYYAIKGQEERLRKYLISAPFSGVVTAANTQAGSVVGPGQPLGQMMRSGSYELEAMVNLRDLKFIKTGYKVDLRSEDIANTWTGKIRRISSQLDPSTQMVKVFVGVNGRGLREGMFLNGEIAAKVVDDVVEIPRSLLVDGEQVYVVKDSILSLQTVEIVQQNAEMVLVRGLEEGAQLLDQNVIGAFEGMKVQTLNQNAKNN